MSSSNESVSDGEETTPMAEPQPNFPEKTLSHVKNKQRRRELFAKMKLEKQKAKRLARKKRQEEAKALGDKAPPKQVPRTLENTREPDDTMVDPDDKEVEFDEATDEMSAYFDREIVPKVLITSTDNPHTATLGLCKELQKVLPNSTFQRRKRSSIKKMVKAAIQHQFTDIMILNEDRRHPNGMLLIHLPEGPTAYFKISNVVLSRKMKKHAVWSSHRPEIILNNFNTRLGHSIGRMLASLFHYDPQFHGRRVVTFHNQRDYIFFRHHRYEFKDGKKVALHEIGPRFTLRLKSLQKGTFDTKYGEFEWVLKRHEMETSRRRFFL